MRGPFWHSSVYDLVVRHIESETCSSTLFLARLTAFAPAGKALARANNQVTKCMAPPSPQPHVPLDCIQVQRGMHELVRFVICAFGFLAYVNSLPPPPPVQRTCSCLPFSGHHKTDGQSLAQHFGFYSYALSAPPPSSPHVAVGPVTICQAISHGCSVPVQCLADHCPIAQPGADPSARQRRTLMTFASNLAVSYYSQLGASAYPSLILALSFTLPKHIEGPVSC